MFAGITFISMSWKCRRRVTAPAWKHTEHWQLSRSQMYGYDVCSPSFHVTSRRLRVESSSVLVIVTADRFEWSSTVAWLNSNCKHSPTILRHRSGSGQPYIKDSAYSGRPHTAVNGYLVGYTTWLYQQQNSKSMSTDTQSTRVFGSEVATHGALYQPTCYSI